MWHESGMGQLRGRARRDRDAAPLEPPQLAGLSGRQRARCPAQSGSMNALDWDHNAYYHRLLLRQLPRPCRRVLAVGCGAGALAPQLAPRAQHVAAPDHSADLVEAARQRTPDNVPFLPADLLGESLPAGYP